MNIGPVLLLLLLAVIGEVPGADLPPSHPTIVRTIGPVRPGETVLLIGDWPPTASAEFAQLGNQGAGATLPWQHLDPVQVSSQSMKCTIPGTWTMGAYACRVVDDHASPPTASAIVLLNLPDPWWLQGDGGATAASPGGWLRIFGKALHLDAPTRVRLENAGKVIELMAQETGKDAGGYALTVAIPVDLPAGGYSATVHNGLGGPDAWSPAGRILIQPVPDRKPDIFDVSTQAPATDDSTEAVRAALAKAASNGGGVVYFPRGRYRITDRLVIPARVTLKGEGEGLVSLHWPARDKALASLIEGQDDFAVEDLSIYTHGVHKSVITGRNHVRVQRVRIRANFFFRHDFVGKPTGSMDGGMRIGPVVEPTNHAGAGVHITGDHATITDCDIYHSLFAVTLNTTCGGLVARNRFDCGGGGFQFYCVSRVIIEDNEVGGSALWASGNALSLYGGECASYHVYYAGNRTRQVYGGDREAITTDGHGTAYLGKIANVQGDRLLLADESWWGNAKKDMISQQDCQRTIDHKRPTGEFACEEWHGATLFIVSGRGTGQYRNVLECAGREVRVERPFTLPPDATSIVSIGKFQGRHLFIGNEFRDSKPSVQLYAPCCDCVVAGNQVWRTETMNSLAIIMGKRVELSWYNQFLDNHIWEGNGWAGNSMALEIQGSVRISGDKEIRSLIPSMGHVIRGNRLDNNACIRVTGEVRDVVIEHNAVQHAELGISVGASPGPHAGEASPAEGIWVGDNRILDVAMPTAVPK